MTRSDVAILVGVVVLGTAAVLQWGPSRAPAVVPSGGDAAITADVRTALQDVSPAQRAVIAMTSTALAQWMRSDPPARTSNIATTARLAYRIGGWDTGSTPAFSQAFKRAFDDAGLSRDVELTNQTAAAAAAVFEAIAAGAGG